MPVITRSNIRTALRNRRNATGRKFTFVLRSHRAEDSETEYDYESESEYVASESESSTTTDTETVDDSESDSDLVLCQVCDEKINGADDSESESDSQPEVVQNLRNDIDTLRSELAVAERMLQIWEEEQEAFRKDNRTCARFLTGLFVAVIVFVGLTLSADHYRA